MKNILFLLALTLFSCKNAPKTGQTDENTLTIDTLDTSIPNNTENSTTPPPVVLSKTDKPVQNLTVVPKQQVGLITPRMTEKDIIKAYGENNVLRIDRGDVKNLILPNTPNELELSWKKGFDYQKLETAIIRKGYWKTAEGIGIGTTVENLNKINNKPVELYEIEDGIALVRWKGGSVNPNLKVVVDMEKKIVIEMQIDF